MAHKAQNRIGSNVISANEVYSRTDLKQRGYTDTMMDNARRSGIVKPRDGGNYDLYLGSEIIEWVKSLPVKDRQRVAG